MPTVTRDKHHAQLLPQVSAGQESADAIAQGQCQFDQHHEGDADDAVEVEQEEDDEMEGMECPPQRPPTPLRGAEVRFGGAAGEVVAVGAAAAEQALAQQAQPGLDLGRRGRIEHADRAARLPVAKTKTRHRAGHPVKQLALDRRGGRGQAGIECQRADTSSAARAGGGNACGGCAGRVPVATATSRRSGSAPGPAGRSGAGWQGSRSSRTAQGSRLKARRTRRQTSWNDMES